MSISKEDLFKEIIKIDAVQSMKVSVNSAIKYGTLVGVTTIVSGILGGPIGMALGGVVSSVTAGYMSRGKLKPIPYILCYETTPEQREKLSATICNFLKTKHITTIYDFISSIKYDKGLEEAIIQILIMFLSSEMGIAVTYN